MHNVKALITITVKTTSYNETYGLYYMVYFFIEIPSLFDWIGNRLKNSSGVLGAAGYPSETHLTLKSREQQLINP